MGARPEQQLALNFLAAVHELWLEHPGSYVVKESSSNLIAALAQMCIKALAVDVRDSSIDQADPVDGELIDANGTSTSLKLRDVFNKIIHGTPASVEVRDSAVWLRFNNSSVGAGEAWTEAVFSGTQVIQLLGTKLHKHGGADATAREREIKTFLETLGPDGLLPTRQQHFRVG